MENEYYGNKMPGWEAILDWIYFTAKVWIHRKKIPWDFFCFLHITIIATKNIADTQALMIDDFNTDVAELIKLAFLQFSCFHLLNLPDEFSTKTHMVLKKKKIYFLANYDCNLQFLLWKSLPVISKFFWHFYNFFPLVIWNFFTK